MTETLNLKEYLDSIFEIKTEEAFEKLALQAFHFQYKHLKIYQEYADLLGKNKPQSITEIPFLPIDFFKYHEIRSQTKEVQTLFKSSGTTQQLRSMHFIEDCQLYERSFETAYRQFVGNPENQVIIALLPNYVEQKFSSLVYMVEHLIKLSSNDLSAFYLYDKEEIVAAYQQAIEQGKEVVVFGVTYALLDLAEAGTLLTGAKIIETGGMKGRRKELSKEELHQILKTRLQVQTIFSEYGMCELLSQAYSEGTLFETPAWMKVLIRDKNDPFQYVSEGKSGGINVIDLANIFSCCFIQTQDLGKKHKTSFEVLGRIDNAEIRGCNLMIGG